jgi:hypothetical protein
MSMDKRLQRIFKAIERITKIEDEELADLIKEFPEADALIQYIAAYEKDLAKLLKEEKKFFIQAVQQYLAGAQTGNILVQAMLDLVVTDMLADDPFDAKLAAQSKAFLTKACQELCTKIMDIIDKDVPFQILSPRTTQWIESWSEDLGKLMKLTSHEAVENVLKKGIAEGLGIDKIVDEMKDLPEFSRRRARATAITEVLTASSVSQNEAYAQSPAVEGKTWLHSGSKKNKPREHHVKLHDVTIGKNEKFLIEGPKGSFQASFPRDTALPASERVFCHCALAPSVNESILGLSKQEKESIREQVLRELGKV